MHRKINLRSKATIGYIVMILSAIFAGLTNAFAKPLIDVEGFSTMEISPITLVALVFLINFFFFTPLTKNSIPLKTIGKRNLFFLTIIGISEVAGLVTYFYGLKESTAINSAIMSEGEMIFSLLIAITILRERLKRKELTPFAMIIVGMVIIPIGFDLHQNGFTMSELVFGDMLILTAGIFYALDINLCKYVSKRFDAKRITQITSLASGVFALGLMFMFNIPFNIDWSQLPSIVLLSIIGTGLATFFFIIALRLIGAVRSLLIYSSSSAFGVIFSSIFLGETITMANVVSIILVIGGIYLLRNRLADDGTDEIKIHQTKPKDQILEKRKGYKLQEIRIHPNGLISQESYSEKLSNISRNLFKLNQKMRLWGKGNYGFLFNTYDEALNVYKCYLGRGIIKTIYQKNKVNDKSSRIIQKNSQKLKQTSSNSEGK